VAWLRGPERRATGVRGVRDGGRRAFRERERTVEAFFGYVGDSEIPQLARSHWFTAFLPSTSHKPEKAPATPSPARETNKAENTIHSI
jgi:hypothetical protein